MHHPSPVPGASASVTSQQPHRATGPFVALGELAGDSAGNRWPVPGSPSALANRTSKIRSFWQFDNPSQRLADRPGHSRRPTRPIGSLACLENACYKRR